MEIAERKKFDLLLSNYCVQKIGWNANESEQDLKQKFASCIHLVSRAETIFRGHMLNPVPGEVKYYTGPLGEQ